MNVRRSSGALSEADADALLSGRVLAEHDDLREIIGLMKMASTVPAPPPNAALAAMLDDGFAPLPVEAVQRGSRWGRWGVRIRVATAAAMTVTLGAATANALPAPVQNAVANVVRAVTSLQLPRPEARPENGGTDSGGAGDQPAGVPREQLNSSDTSADQPSGESAETTVVTPETAPSRPKAPAAVAPPRRPTTTATPADKPDQRDADDGRPLGTDETEYDDHVEPEQDTGEVGD